LREQIDVLGLGNSLVDILTTADDEFLSRHEMAKGAMTLIDEDRAESLFGLLAHSTTMSGGSAANTIVGVASLGVSSAYIGKVKHDALGETFRRDIRQLGVGFDTHAALHGPATGRCFVFVTPEGERTMQTFLGASSYLAPTDVDEELVRSARFVYLEGYMWDRPDAKEAFRKAGRIARAAGARVALTLSDSFCVDRFRGEFIELMRSGIVDTVFANTDEALSLYETPHLHEAFDALAKEGVVAAVTRSEKGSVVIEGDKFVEVPAFPIKGLVDTTGAGDLYAAGFLAGLAHGKDHAVCARLGALAAAEVIQHFGARPQTSLRELADRAHLFG
jgi:sugar/nucleoside kinase (ribokinase family)